MPASLHQKALAVYSAVKYFLIKSAPVEFSTSRPRFSVMRGHRPSLVVSGGVTVVIPACLSVLITHQPLHPAVKRSQYTPGTVCQNPGSIKTVRRTSRTYNVLLFEDISVFFAPVIRHNNTSGACNQQISFLSYGSYQATIILNAE